MRLRLQHLGATMSRSQVHHSGGIRVDPPRVGDAAVRRPGGSLRRWVPPEGVAEDGWLDTYLEQALGRHLAVLADGSEEDGYASNSVLRVGHRQSDGSYLVSTTTSRYRVSRVA